MTSFSGSLRVGLVHNWPGAKNSELDIILRIIPVLESLGHRGVIIDPLGQELDSAGSRLASTVKHDDFDLVLNLHYLNPKLLSGLSYAVNWNPLAYIVDDPITRTPLPVKQLNYIADCFRSHDRILSAGSTQVDEFVEVLRADNSATWLPASDLSLHTSIVSPVDNSPVAVTADHAKVFYIGVNWEKLSKDKQRTVRHKGLFETLDRSGEFVFYGLREQYGVPLWEGVKHYHGELPFDGGQSIIEKSRGYGITLVLSSQQHRDSALVSTRIFQACAAGTVIITDRNGFIEKHFGDKVYYFDYGDTPGQTAETLLRLVKQIKQEWPLALEKARDCQRLFLRNFALEKEVKALCEQVRRDISAREHFINAVSQTIHVVVDCRVYGPAAADQARKFCANQRVKPQRLHVLCSVDQYETLSASMSGNTVITLYQTPSPLGRFLVEQGDNLGWAFVVFTPDLRWNSDHILQLLSVSHHTGRPAYSPSFTHYQSLENVHETMEYGIKGLSVSRISESVLSRFSAHRFATGNILIQTSVLRSLDHAHQKIGLFGAGVLLVILYEYFLVSGKLPMLSSAVTSYWHTKEEYGTVAFNQYDIANDSEGLYRDRNLFSVLYANTNPQISALLQLWELQQEQGRLGNDESAEYQISLLLSQVGALKQQYSNSSFSRQFSLYFYLKHLFRNRPMMLRFIKDVHQFFAKLLKV